MFSFQTVDIIWQGKCKGIFYTRLCENYMEFMGGLHRMLITEAVSGVNKEFC